MPTSTICPLPPRPSRLYKAVTAPRATKVAASESPRLIPTRGGGRSGYPVTCRIPPMASPMDPNPAWSLYGPVCPYPETRTMTRPALISLKFSYPRPHFSSVPGLKFSTTTSASEMRRRARFCPSFSRRLRVTDFLLRAIMGHHRVRPSLRWRPQTRIGSPLPGGSSFITSAPKSARSWPQKGPARRLPISTTRTPSRGRAPLPLSGIHILLQGADDEVAALVDVLAHDDLGPVGIALLKSLQDLAVIVVGDYPLVGRVPEERLEHERYLDGAVDEALEAPVAARLYDGAVEILVERDEGPYLLLMVVEPAGQPLHLPGQLPQPHQLVPLYASGRTSGGVALQYGPQVVDIPHVFEGERAHGGPAIRRDLDESLGLEHGEGLPHGRPAHPEPLRELLLDQTLIRTVLARQDQSPQPLQSSNRPRSLPRTPQRMSHSNPRFRTTENPLYTILGAHESCVKNCKAGDRPWCAGSALDLPHLYEHGASWDEGAFFERERVDHARVGGRDGLLHLHGLEDEKELALLDFLALFDEHLHDRTRHRGCEAGGGISARSHLVHGRGRGLAERIGVAA